MVQLWTPSTFKALPDTPDAYSGQGGKRVAVNSVEDALEFVAATEHKWEHIETKEVSSVDAVTFSGLSTDWKAYRLMCMNMASLNFQGIRFNGDAGPNYKGAEIYVPESGTVLGQYVGAGGVIIWDQMSPTDWTEVDTGPEETCLLQVFNNETEAGNTVTAWFRDKGAGEHGADVGGCAMVKDVNPQELGYVVIATDADGKIEWKTDVSRKMRVRYRGRVQKQTVNLGLTNYATGLTYGICGIPGDSEYGFTTCWIQNLDASKPKTWMAVSTREGTMMRHTGGEWNNTTDKITSITLTPLLGVLTGTFVLEGIK